ncbi:MAG: LysM peptidoglycan-binding domain-containing protein [Chloroflexota bacterium]
MKRTIIILLLFSSLVWLSACNRSDSEIPPILTTPTPIESTITPVGPTPTTIPVRPLYNPGELVSYTAQMGDSIDSLAERFNTSAEEILAANSFIPETTTTMPAGMPMEIPIYYRTFWGTAYQIIPDSLYVNGPAAAAFDTAEFVEEYNGWLNRYSEYAGGENRSGAEIIDLVARNYSISPRVLLALSEYLAGALNTRVLPESAQNYPLGFRSTLYQGYYWQLLWSADQLNQGYYGWREGSLLELDLQDGTIERPDPWQNAATVSLQHLFSKIMPTEQYHTAISPDGFAAVYIELFGEPWGQVEPHIPGSLTQPGLLLPIPAGETWAFTGGPHTAWGNGPSFSALDFAPSTTQTGCYFSDAWTTALADGIVTRAEPGYLILDLDLDGDERTGWVIFYLHISGQDLIAQGSEVKAGDPLGHPSCEGGSSTGTHIHLARKYNGEWIAAAGTIPFVMEGWVPATGDQAYLGSMSRFEKMINACECATKDTLVQGTGNVSGVMILPTPSPTP